MRSFSEVMALKVIPEKECFGSFPELIPRVPKWLKEVSVGVIKPGQENVMHSGILLNIPGKEAAEKMVPKGRKVSGEITVEAESGVQRLERGSASNSGLEKLMGLDEASQGYFGAFYELLNMKETLCKLKEEVDVVLIKIQGAIKFLGLGGMGQGVRSPCDCVEAQSWVGFGLGSEAFTQSLWVGDPRASSSAILEPSSVKGVCKETLAKELTGGMGSPLQGGLLPTKVIGRDMKDTDSLGFLEKAGECSGGGGLTDKESSDGMGFLERAGGGGLTVNEIFYGLSFSKKASECSGGGGLAVKESSGGLGFSEKASECSDGGGLAVKETFSDLGESEAADAVNQCMEEELHCHRDADTPLKLSISEFFSLGVDSGGSQGQNYAELTGIIFFGDG
ncbi:hypothetical protein FH972_011008 [Carpinus fangiana]|uniref:Uncharacterized protein n=1 Tax=Carpinus fangiana TaxID=176857 RepID=A0A660KWZ9_9ROSI|nr:hypothetical protein FH972_011008 [Carpinus fangiana]